MPSDRDLGELLAATTRRVIEAERPLLQAQGLTMWEYVVLVRLGRGSAPTQLALARSIDYDKTRLIALLDGLADRGLIARGPDPADRRARVIELTDAGQTTLAATRASIREMESTLLAPLPESERAALRAALARLAGPRPAA